MNKTSILVLNGNCKHSLAPDNYTFVNNTKTPPDSTILLFSNAILLKYRHKLTKHRL